MKEAHNILKNTFGYDDFRHNQAAIIAAVLNGQDVLALMPTGGGKSLCYQIPALVQSGVGIVVSPLIALMHDQVSALSQLGVSAAYLNSTLDSATVHNIEQSLLNGEIDLLYVAPERLLNPRMLALLDQVNVALFAIDEAHCVSQWGHDFRKEYQQLSILHQRYPSVPRIALTATADARTREEIISQLQLQEADIFVDSFDRPNIRYSIVEGANARNELWEFIKDNHSEDAGIIYCLSRKKVEKTAEWLAEKGRKALPYHAGLPAEMRQLHQERFLREQGVIIVATVAFGMGIDKPDVRFVAHLSLPKSIEAYYQETGRAGRDGADANAWMAYGLQDVIMLRQMMQDTDAEEAYKRISQQKLESMLGLCEMTSCRRQTVLAYFDEVMEKPCGNCDNCLSPPVTRDATVDSQKALSCVFRSGQRFGVSYIVDVLRGKDDERIKSNHHDQVSTFGLGKDLSVAQWKSIFRQLIAQGYVDVNHEAYGALQLNEKSRPLLKGELAIQLRQEQKKEKTKKAKKSSENVRTANQPLFEALRSLRLQLAEEQGVPSYIIFHDSTLQEMASKRPMNLNDMQYISGVGEQKLSRYGSRFLEVIIDHPLPELLDNRLSDTINETLQLHVDGKKAQEIAQQRDIGIGTVYNHFAEAIESGLLEPLDVLPIDKGEYLEIVQAMEMVNSCEEGRLKSLYEALDDVYDYGVLKCVMAANCI